MRTTQTMAVAAVFAAGVLLGARASLGQGGEPAAAGAQARVERTELQFAKERLEYLTQRCAKVYAASEWTGEAWDQEVAKVHAAAVKWQLREIDPAAFASVRESALKARKAGCEDPLVLWFLGELIRTRDEATANELNSKAAPALLASDYPALFSVQAMVREAKVAVAAKDVARNKATRKGSEDALLRILTEESMPGTDGLELRYRLIEQFLVDKYMLPILTSFSEKAQADERVDGWLKEMVQGTLAVTSAWDARGSGMANTVKEEGWKGFSEKLQEARTHLEEAYRLQPGLPQSATLMMKVAQGGEARDGQDVEYWFKRATKARLDYYQAYREKLFNLRPRWGGSHAAMLGFGLRVAGLERHDTKLGWVLVDAVKGVAEETEDMPALLSRPQVSGPLEAALKGMFENPAHQRDRGLIIVTRMAIASVAGNHELAAELHDLMDREKLGSDESIVDVWQFDAARFDGMTDALHSSAKDTVAKALAAERGAEWGEARRLYEEAARVLGEQDKVSDGRLGALRCEAYAGVADAIATGGTYAWHGDESWPGVPGLFKVGGGWSQKNGVIEAMPLPREGMLARCSSAVGDRYEVSVEVDGTEAVKTLEDVADPAKRVVHAGVVVGYKPLGDYPRWISVQCAFGRNEVVVAQGWTREAKRIAVATLGTSVKLRVQVWDEELAVFVNEEMVFHGPWPMLLNKSWGSHFGLGGLLEAPYSKPVLYKGLKVKGLKAAPAWIDGDEEVAPPVDRDVRPQGAKAGSKTE